MSGSNGEQGGWAKKARKSLKVSQRRARAADDTVGAADHTARYATDAREE